MLRIGGRAWCLLVLAIETMSMRRGVPGGLRMPPAAAHDRGVLPRELADAPNTYPRPRAPCSTCGGELVYCFGDERGPYLRHLRNATGCTGGGEGDLHKWAKEDLADYLRNKTMLHFVSRCKSCDANVNHPSVPVKDRRVKTEYQLPSGGRADIAVCVGNEPKVIIEVLNTNPTDNERFPRPEPWYEVDAKAVLRMLKLNQSSAELECVRPDGPDRGKCYKCKRVQKERDRRGKWKLRGTKHNGKTFEEVSSEYSGWCQWVLGEVVKGQYQELNEQICDGYSGTRIAFELPKGEWRNVSSVFRDSKIYGGLLAFAEYLVNDPDLYAIESAGELAMRVRKQYKPGQQQVKGVTVVQFDSRSGNWTNPKDAYEGRYYSKRVYDGPVDRMLENMGRRRGDIWWVL